MSAITQTLRRMGGGYLNHGPAPRKVLPTWRPARETLLLLGGVYAYGPIDRRDGLFLRCHYSLEQGGPMKWIVGLQVGMLTLALTVPGVLVTPITGYAQTESKERRDDRQDDRKGERDINKGGPSVARTPKCGA